jgi:hypothetical protein
MLVTLFIQDAMRMRLLQYLWSFRLSHTFSTLFHKRHDFREKGTDSKICVLIFYTLLSETFFIVRRTGPDIRQLFCATCKAHVVLVRFYPLDCGAKRLSTFTEVCTFCTHNFKIILQLFFAWFD